LLNILKKNKNTKGPVDVARTLMSAQDDEQMKLYTTWRSLEFRRDNPQLFHQAKYVPLRAEGRFRDHICAFAWDIEKYELLVVVPRLLYKMTIAFTIPPIGTQAWIDTILILPEECLGKRYQNIFTGEILKIQKRQTVCNVLIADVLNIFPVAVLAKV
jgi:(1->4)-alpha-D-glucan 1-alpha-D-glucosylmutase